jgi:DNA-directed RNA polymerase II subunit RPB1
MLRYSLTDAPPVRPRRLRFGLLSADEIAKMAVCKVTETMLYYRGLPASGGLLDPLMGTVDRRHKCASCLRDPQTCQGHPGYLQLSFPCYHIGYMETVLKILRSTCFGCTRVCVSDETADAMTGNSGKTRMGLVHHSTRTQRKCPHCDMPRPIVTRVPFGFSLEWPEGAVWESEEERDYCTQQFTARDALSILENLSDEDIVLLGLDPVLSHPKNMIFQNLVVPPVCTRPAIYTSEGSRSRGQNDLTVRLLEILKRSNDVGVGLASHTWRSLPPAELTQDLCERIYRLQYEVFMLINSNSRIQKPPGMGRGGSNVNAKCLQLRLRGKEGRVRGNLMGKRVNQSARCVISPDAYFDPDRVGVPYKIAKILTVPETVNNINICALSERVRLGAQHLHGANTILHSNGDVTDLVYCRDRSSIVLRPGDVVERHLDNGDSVIFNRQPSLHMHGMLCHKVRLMPGHTFRLSLVCSGQYNADFDGDEMNLHVPQSKTAIAECATLMSIGQKCIGAQSNKPMMGIVQDSLLGCHKLSHVDCFFDHSHVCRLLGVLRHRFTTTLPLPAVEVRPPEGTTVRLWTGKQVFSAVLPPALHLYADLPGTGEVHDRDLPVVVHSGQLLCGVLRKAHVGTGAGGIVDVIAREHGGNACLRFMGDTQRLTHAFLLQRAHHVGIDDVMLSAEGHAQVTERLQKATRLCEEIQREMCGAPTDVAQTGEDAILRILSKTLQQTGGIVNEHMDDTNAIRCMVSGANSKGSFINLSQICAALGQQSLEGRRIVADKGTRTLPCFAHNDLSLASRGMVFNSFALGLSPSELFYHAIGGREGLVDTAVKTSQTGYLQRRMNKGMEDTTIHPDGTLRNSMKEIVSFKWGSDGLHPSRLERAKLNLLVEGEASIRARMSAEESAVAIAARGRILTVKTHVLVAEFDPRVLLPFHPRRLAHTVRRHANPEDPVGEAAASAAVLGLVRDDSMCDVVRAALLDVLCSTAAGGMDRKAHATLLSQIEARIVEARAPVGESVGCIAAQSVGEPTTQLTLNTFHTAGCAEKNVTLGLPRVKELIDASKSPKTPCTTVRFRSPYARNRAFVEYMAQTLPLTRLGDVVRKTAVVHDPDRDSTCVPEDEWMVRCESRLGNAGDDDSSVFVVRLELDQETMRARQLTPPMVRRMLTERLSGNAVVASSEANAVDWAVRVRFSSVAGMVKAGSLSRDQEAILVHRAMNVLLDTMVLSGHPDLNGVDVAEEKTGEFVLHVYGSVLLDCVALAPVDWARTTSNDVWEIYHTLGIEACAHVLFEQLKTVLSFDGGYIDDRHITVIVDSMCRGGNGIMPLNRHGINRTDQSPLMRCSFEETSDVLFDAALQAETENALCVTTSIMTGQLAQVGTGTAQVLFPSKKPIQTAGGARIGGRVMRSTCRSYVRHDLEETIEYVMESARPGGTRPLSPNEGSEYKRARFRPASPPPREL